jgi:hypothetical protein
MGLDRNILRHRPLNKAIALFLLVFQGVFLNIVVPGHVRGVITLSGKNSVTSLVDLGCPCCCRPSKHDPNTTPSDKDKSECAICHIAAALTLPPVMDFAPPLLCLARVRETTAPTLTPLLRVQFVRQDRAPPRFA